MRGIARSSARAMLRPGDGQVRQVVPVGDRVRDRHGGGANVQDDAVARRQHRRRSLTDQAFLRLIAGDPCLVNHFRHSLDDAHGAAAHPSDAAGPRQDVNVAADGDFRNAELAGEVVNAREFVVADEGQQLLASRVGPRRLGRGDGLQIGKNLRIGHSAPFACALIKSKASESVKPAKLA
jgi:hypothetical protein